MLHFLSDNNSLYRSSYFWLSSGLIGRPYGRLPPAGKEYVGMFN